MKRDFKIGDVDWSASLWARIKSLFGGLDSRVTALEQGGGGGGGGGAVSGVKGDAESSYRTGNVNLTYANVGAPSKNGTGASGTWGISITGNAATATSATKATQDGNGAVIPSTYVKKTDVIDISHGGSGMTGVTAPYVGISNIVASTETGWEITEAYCSVWGKLASVKLRVKRTGAAITSSGTQSICTLRNELKPLVDSYAGVPSINVAGGALGVGGEVNIIVFDTWGQNAVKSVYLMYILA